MSIWDRALATFGLQRMTASGNQPGVYQGATHGRLNADWAIAILSADQEIRTSLRNMRARSRQLARDNPYAVKFLNLARTNVIGSEGINLEVAFDESLVGGADGVNRKLEAAWKRFCEAPSTDGQMSMVDTGQLWIESKLKDGETFLRRVKGYPHNPSRFALQFLDADQFPEMVNSYRRLDSGSGQNDIRMSVEVDEWRRPVAYHAYEGHPSEQAGVRRIRIPADELDHSYIFRRTGQTRGVPWLHAAMGSMNMLGGYIEAELVAARLAACKMAALESKTGDDYVGKTNPNTGSKELDVEPGSLWQLAEGQTLKPIDWQHPNAAFPEFTKAMLRGVAVGIDVSYSSLTGDLREVNFSSIRHGALEERDGWRVLQSFTVKHFYRKIFAGWLQMAVTTGVVEVPARMPLAAFISAAIDASIWTPRGWDWVDPKKDVDADIAAIRSCLSTLSERCAKRGINWRDNIDQRAREIQYAKSKGVPIDLTTSGAGGIEADTAAEEGAHETSPSIAPGGGGNKPNGKGALESLARLTQ